VIKQAKRVRIVYLITELNLGGAERALARAVAGLSRDRYNPLVVCLFDPGIVADQIRASGVQVIDLRAKGKWDLSVAWRLYRLLRRERPTILHTWMFHANVPGRLLGRLAGVPIIISSERTMGQESRWRYRLNRITAPLTDRVVCVSQQVADFVVQEVGIPQCKVVVIPNGIDLRNFKYLPAKRQARAALGLPYELALIGTVARLNPVKRLDVLLQALASVNGVCAVIIGDGPERARLEALRKQLGLVERVRFVGQQSNVPEWLAAMDLFVLPSDWEGMSNALLEAMAVGLPVVATAVGGTPEVVVDGVTGLLVPPRDPEALAEAIIALLQDRERAEAMGRTGQERVERYFTVERMVQKTEALYEELIGEKMGLMKGAELWRE